MHNNRLPSRSAQSAATHCSPGNLDTRSHLYAARGKILNAARRNRRALGFGIGAAGEQRLEQQLATTSRRGSDKGHRVHYTQPYTMPRGRWEGNDVCGDEPSALSRLRALALCTRANMLTMQSVEQSQPSQRQESHLLGVRKWIIFRTECCCVIRMTLPMIHQPLGNTT